MSRQSRDVLPLTDGLNFAEIGLKDRAANIAREAIKHTLVHYYEAQESIDLLDLCIRKELFLGETEDFSLAVSARAIESDELDECATVLKALARYQADLLEPRYAGMVAMTHLDITEHYQQMLAPAGRSPESQATAVNRAEKLQALLASPVT